MKVKVQYTVYVDDGQRKAIARHYGYGQTTSGGLATAEAVKAFLEMHGTGGLESLSSGDTGDSHE